MEKEILKLKIVLVFNIPMKLTNLQVSNLLKNLFVIVKIEIKSITIKEYLPNMLTFTNEIECKMQNTGL